MCRHNGLIGRKIVDSVHSLRLLNPGRYGSIDSRCIVPHDLRDTSPLSFLIGRYFEQVMETFGPRIDASAPVTAGASVRERRQRPRRCSCWIRGLHRITECDEASRKPRNQGESSFRLEKNSHSSTSEFMWISRYALECRQRLARVPALPRATRWRNSEATLSPMSTTVSSAVPRICAAGGTGASAGVALTTSVSPPAIPTRRAKSECETKRVVCGRPDVVIGISVYGVVCARVGDAAVCV